MGQFRFLKIIIIILSNIFAASQVAAGDWPQWRGPFLNGSAEESGLPASWDAERDAKWGVELPGEAGSTPVVCGSRIFLTSTDAQSTNLYALCLNRADGRVLWSKTITGKGRQEPYNMDASPSPVSDGERTTFLFGQGTFFAVDNGGRMLWRRELEKEIGPLTITFLYSASPLLYRGRLYVPMIRDNSTSNSDRADLAPVNNLESCLMCVDPATGKDIWKVPRVNEEYTVENRDSYATPAAWEATFGTSATTAIVTVGGNFLTGHDWRSGKELWRLRYGKTGGYRQRVVPTPLVTGDFVVASKPRRGPLYAVRPGVGELTTASVAWQFTATATDTPSLLLYRGRVYNLQEKEKTLTCIDPKNGATVWTGKLGGGTALYFASPTGADGKIYCVNQSGEVVVVEAGDQFKVLGRAKMGGNPTNAGIVAAGGELFIRTAKRLYCIGGRGGK